jgi:hypothetical protein
MSRDITAFRGEDWANYRHALTCMSRPTFAITLELDKARSVCRPLIEFLTAYSRLPGGPVRRKAS